MDIVKVSIPKVVLDQVPPTEKNFIASISYMTNQICLLQKLLLIANKPQVRNEVEESGNVMTIGFLLRMLAGHVNEGWELIQKAYFKAKLSKTYEGKLPEAGSTALSSMKEYFKNKNLVRTVRSRFAFHVPTDHLESALEKDTEPLEFYFAEATGNCLYMGAEALAMWELIEAAGGGDHAAGMDKFFEEVLNVSRWYTTFANNCLQVFFDGIGMENEGLTRKTIQIEEVAEWAELRLPYLVE